MEPKTRLSGKAGYFLGKGRCVFADPNFRQRRRHNPGLVECAAHELEQGAVFAADAAFLQFRLGQAHKCAQHVVRFQ